MKSKALSLLIVTLFSVVPGFCWPKYPVEAEFSTSNSGQVYNQFYDYLEVIRTTLKIPGMSAAIVQDQELVWAEGFGYADLENQVAAAADTPYGLASVTKPIAAVLIMQLVEEGLIDLDDPVHHYGVNKFGKDVTVRHLLTHTSEGIPGTVHEYNGNRYGHLGGVVEGAIGKTFAELMSEKFLQPLRMESTALNPINSWGGNTLSPWEDLQITLGFGEAYKHYPDVYRRLARPYQLGDDYDVIPGMYQLYHNPAAGLISSVTDLAKFDQALDNGTLLEPQIKEEMFIPRFSTSKNREDLNYGLGWYVQDFEGLRMLWHTGRWPPSTSALYLKIPEKNLTFIVLANTDKLTTPFNSIGHGDVSKSTLVLAFFRYFIFPDLYGRSLTDIDWSSGSGILTSQLHQIEDEAERRYLERELWSFRKAYASVGREDQARILGLVDLRVFPDSSMRDDEFFTHTAGKFPVIPPNISALGYWRLSWGICAWLVLVLISMALMVIRLMQKKCFSWKDILWILSTLFLGPIALILLSRTKDISVDDSLHIWKGALQTGVFAVGVSVLGWWIAFSILVGLGNDPHPLVILGSTYLVPLLCGILLHQLPATLSWGKVRVFPRFSRSLLPELITNNISFAVMFPLLMILNNRFLNSVPLDFGLFTWVMLSALSFVNILVQYPFQYWMRKQGYLTWGHKIYHERNIVGEFRMRKCWQIFVLSFLFFILSLILTIMSLD
jgi:CubicO group peptidase (beta-lactamase class C family)